MAEQCPTLEHFKEGEQCTENYAGLSPKIYVGLKADLTAPLTETDGTYVTPAFSPSKGFYEIDCKENTVNIKGSSLGKRKGFKLTLTFTLDVVNEISAKLGRAFNNLDLFFVIPDGEKWQIVYDVNRKIMFDTDGIASDTGSAPEDDRTTVYTATLSPVKYPNLYVTIDDISTLLKGAEG